MLASCRMWCPATNSKIAATTPRANRRRASPSNVALFMSVPAFVVEAMLPPRRREWLGRWVAPPLAIEKGAVPLDLRVVKRPLYRATQFVPHEDGIRSEGRPPRLGCSHPTQLLVEASSPSIFGEHE